MIARLAVLVAAIPSVAHAGWETRVVAGSNVHVYTPVSRGTAGSGRGLIIGLHGCVQTNDALRDRGAWEPAAEDFGIVIALPNAPNGGVIAGCWDYYGTNHARTGRHDGFLLELAETLAADAALMIDREQRYIAGLSSGAGEAAVMGCLAPDVFAGVGINAGPAVGTSSSEASIVASDAATAARNCEALAGAAASAFSTQLASIIAGTNDHIVAQGYNTINAEALVTVYGGGMARASFDVSALPGHAPAGQGTLWSDAAGPRVSLIIAEGMGHAFPAGSGPGPEINFVASAGVSWPYYLAELFSTNNRRVSQVPAGDGGVRADGGAVRPGADAATAGEGGEPREGSGCACVPMRARVSPWLLVLALFSVRRRAS